MSKTPRRPASGSAVQGEQSDIVRRELSEQNIEPDTPFGRWLYRLLAHGERGSEKDRPAQKKGPARAPNTDRPRSSNAPNLNPGWESPSEAQS
jgi:hypothetical protein